jgi:ATP phosphoribosyltransferase regulatory subunit
MTTASAAAVLARLAASSGSRVDPPMVLPARTIVEMSGEAVRARLCTFTDGTGHEFCLRPDMTTPIAAMVARGDLPIGRFHYAGPVFRLPVGPGEPIEFEQVGFEWFGGGGGDEDAEALSLAFDAAHAATASCVARIGDVALFAALLEALPLSPSWRLRLRGAFARRRGPLELIADALERPAESALAAALARLSPEDARQLVEEMSAAANLRPVGGRTPADIAARLQEKGSHSPPSASALAPLKAYVELDVPAKAASKALKDFAASFHLDLGSAIEAFDARMNAIARRDPPGWSTARFSPSAGQRFRYYDGLVFELARAQEPDRPIVAGGRYDGLLQRLGAQTASTAIGAALRVDRFDVGEAKA